MIAMQDILHTALTRRTADRELDVMGNAVTPEMAYYQQMQPLLQQDLAVSQGQLMQAFGGEGGGLMPVTGETVIGKR